ncbi:MAG: DUF2585 family protein [Planctomycetes bacterium]|nr:DUF2585 family protein [Planctomycetota bacterium]
MGRIWWCECGGWSPWVSDIWSRHCSQHLVDWYTFSHVSHGLLFYVGLRTLSRWLPARWRNAFTPGWWFVAAILLETGWEILENTPLVIERYRAETASLNYTGDSIINSVGDILACAAGFAIARCLGCARAVILFVALELLTLWFIRDNLTLNVVMLLSPIEAVRAWQMPAEMR